jgi:hypothetical protein
MRFALCKKQGPTGPLAVQSTATPSGCHLTETYPSLEVTRACFSNNDRAQHHLGAAGFDGINMVHEPFDNVSECIAQPKSFFIVLVLYS